MSDLKVNSITGNTSAGVHIPGHVMQVQFAQYADTFQQSISANTDTIIGSAVLTLNITPKSTSSIIRLDAHVFHEWSSGSGAYESVWFFYRDSTKLAHAAAGSRRSGITTSTISYHSDGTSTPEAATFSYFDTPSTTSQITYKVGVSNHYALTLNVNRTGSDTDGTQWERGISFISATEIAQ